MSPQATTQAPSDAPDASRSVPHIADLAAEHVPRRSERPGAQVAEYLPVITHDEALWISSLSAAELAELYPDTTSKFSRQPSSHTVVPAPVQERDKVFQQHLASEYDGRAGRTWFSTYLRPKRTFDVESVKSYLDRLSGGDAQGKRPFLTPTGEVVWKYEDVDTFLSPIDGVPRRLIAQCTDSSPDEHRPSSWRRTKIKGNVPLALRMAEWSLALDTNTITSIFRQMLVAIPVQILLALPGGTAPWEMTSYTPTHLNYPGYHWKWPKHAKNPLDARDDRKQYEKPQHISSRQRLYRPRQLVVLQDGGWDVVENPSAELAYIFISYHWGSFEKRKDRLDAMARHMCERAGVTAYFQDSRCNASLDDKDLLTSDVNRMCDVIRSSRSVALLLPDEQLRRKKAWGWRMWTLPEGLLAPGRIQVCTWLGRNNYDVRSMSKTELTSEFWEQPGETSSEVPGRILAEHYDGVINLSRLELFTTAIGALKARTTAHDFTGADLAYALMGLLRYRIDPDPTDDLFQALSRLSLANDNDRLIERLMSMFPKSLGNREEFIRSFAEKDVYETYCWDIEPRCQIVGVADEPDSVILGDCRAVPIQWKQFPRMVYKRQHDGKRRLASIAIRSGAWWLGAAFTLTVTYAAIFLALHDLVDEIDDIIEEIPAVHEEELSSQYEKWLWAAIVLFAGISAVLAVFSPVAVRLLFGGPPLQTAPHLVAFEGTLPRDQIERTVFGSDRRRLRYDPSSTPFARWFRHSYIRRGVEPDWLLAGRPPPPAKGYRWFTLVDTGNLTISLFQAQRPPTVAFITGADGGMLRAVLCSWRFANDCHYRETVLRVPSNTWMQCNPTGWVKVCLHSQEDLFAISNVPRTWMANATPTSMLSPQQVDVATSS